jgi:hypothetical protein
LDFIAERLPKIREINREIGIERLCDVLAYELLLPISAVAGVAVVISDIETLMKMAHEWRVSLSFLTLRIRECLNQEIALVYLKSAFDGKWIITENIGGLPGWKMGSILDFLTGSGLDELPPDGVPEEIDLATMGCSRPLRFSVSRRADKAVALWLGRRESQLELRSEMSLC